MQAGYDTSVTTMSSIYHSLADRYVWARVRVGGGESLADFTKSLGSPMQSTNVIALDIERGESTWPPLARPTLQLRS